MLPNSAIPLLHAAFEKSLLYCALCGKAEVIPRVVEATVIKQLYAISVVAPAGGAHVCHIGQLKVLVRMVHVCPESPEASGFANRPTLLELQIDSSTCLGCSQGTGAPAAH